MELPNLWAPWRMEYIRSLDGREHAESPACFLCEAAALQPGSPEARQRLLLRREPRGLILLNRFPYTSGHLLVAPPEHLGDLTDLTPQARAGLIELTALAQRAIRQAFHPQGINIGLNLGRCAGAGLPGHLHLHVVPRWAGDTNFMQVVGQVRIIPQALDESFGLLEKAMASVE